MRSVLLTYNNQRAKRASKNRFTEFCAILLILSNICYVTPQQKNNDDLNDDKTKLGGHVAKKNKIKIKIIILKQKTHNMPILQTALGVGGGLLGGAINAYTQNKANRQNRHFTREMFDKTNAYNTPLKQVERMKEAGLNPAQMYGSGSGAVTSSSSASQPSNPENRPYQVPESLLADIAQKLAGAQLAKANAEATEALTPKKSDLLVEQTKGTRSQTSLTDSNVLKTNTMVDLLNQEYRLNQTLFDTNTQFRKEQLKKLNQDVQEQKIKLNYLDQTQQTELERLKTDLAYKLKQNKNLDLQNWVLENDQKLREMYINPQGNNMVDTVLRYLIGNAKSYINSNN